MIRSLDAKSDRLLGTEEVREICAVLQGLKEKQ